MNLPPELDNSIHKASDIFSFKLPVILMFIIALRQPIRAYNSLK